MAERSFAPLSSRKKYRDAKLIVIATEGEVTEPTYFEDLAFDARFRHPRVVIQVLPAISGLSSPKHVIDRLDKIRRESRLYDGDELWLVIDKDKWEDSMLSEVAQQVLQKGYCLADSNPCFEIWLLLHKRSLDDYTPQEQEELKENRRPRPRSSRTRLEKELIDICGSYDKRNLNTSHYLPFVDSAIENADNADTECDTRWLNNLGSRVYKLVQSIIDSSPNNPLH